MSPEVMQLLYLAGAAAVGWFLRHRGLGASDPTPAVPTLPPNWQPNFKLAGPHPVLDVMSNWILDQLAQALKNAPPPALPPAKAA